MLAAGICDAVGWTKSATVAGCARCCHARIGEAKNPGPARPRRERNFSLEQAPVQTFASLRLGDRRWDVFLTWCSSFISGDVVALFLKVPLLLAHSIRSFGDLDFGAGGSLLYYRHLILAALRKVPVLKPYVSIAWDLATRWEKAEPVQHRVPVPEPLAEALIALAWAHGWKRWCGVVLLCFFGIARAGEVFRCKRADLLLPDDMLHESSAAFLLLRSSKTSYRQAARVQHLKIRNSYVVSLLRRIYLLADPDEDLYPGSAQIFRRRWDYLLQLLNVKVCPGVTPGGLRGGGAVAFYRKGGSVRLKQIATLESYLQEVAALSFLKELSSHSLASIRAAASLFPHLDC